MARNVPCASTRLDREIALTAAAGNPPAQTGNDQAGRFEEIKITSALGLGPYSSRSSVFLARRREVRLQKPHLSPIGAPL
jgi:hypothetical protein